MKILGCDLHAKQQTIAMVDTETGEFTEKTLSQWNHARSAAPPNPSSHAQGLEGKEISSPSGRGRKMSLTSPLQKLFSSLNLRDLESKFGSPFSE